MTKFIGVVETAGMIRKALKESFPEIKFSVRSSQYAGGASIQIRYTDGPNTKQVEAVVKIFEGSYFDGSIDYQGGRYAMLNGEQVKFGADYVFVDREYSDEKKQKAIDAVYRKYEGNFKDKGIEKPTLEAFNAGKCYGLVLFQYNNDNVQRMVYEVLQKSSDRLEVKPSPTAGKIIYLGNDGYSDRGALNPSLANDS